MRISKAETKRRQQVRLHKTYAGYEPKDPDTIEGSEYVEEIDISQHPFCKSLFIQGGVWQQNHKPDALSMVAYMENPANKLPLKVATNCRREYDEFSDSEPQR